MTIQALAEKQLVAYNASSLDEFCDCYHPEVIVFHNDDISIRGLDEFRSRYAPLFADGQFGAEVPQRLGSGRHCVDRETWWRIDPQTGERSEGEVLVRYTERDGKIAVVQFLK